MFQLLLLCDFRNHFDCVLYSTQRSETNAQAVPRDEAAGFPFAFAAIQSVQVTESDSVAMALVYVYQRHGSARQLVETLIRREVADCGEPRKTLDTSTNISSEFSFHQQ